MIIPQVHIQHFEKGAGPGRNRVLPLLAELLSVPESSLVLGESKEGSPFIASPPGVHISVSHSAGFLALYVGPEPAGIDIERLKDRRNLDELASFWFSETEKAAMREWTGNQLTGFYRAWTEKEARFKLAGSEAAESTRAEAMARHWISDCGLMLCLCAGRRILDRLEFVYAEGVDFRAKRLE